MGTNEPLLKKKESALSWLRVSIFNVYEDLLVYMEGKAKRTTQEARNLILLWIIAVGLQMAYYHAKHVIN